MLPQGILNAKNIVTLKTIEKKLSAACGSNHFREKVRDRICVFVFLVNWRLRQRKIRSPVVEEIDTVDRYIDI